MSKRSRSDTDSNASSGCGKPALVSILTFEEACLAYLIPIAPFHPCASPVLLSSVSAGFCSSLFLKLLSRRWAAVVSSSAPDAAVAWLQDLEIIFSRFGNITSCDIIKDWKTGDSLCYAFLGFDSDEACEEAYFKMNNCLIDDRRIKVGHTSALCMCSGDRGPPCCAMLKPCGSHVARRLGSSAYL